MVVSSFHFYSDTELVPFREPLEKFKLENNQEPW